MAPQWQKNKNMEKDIFQEHKKFTGMTFPRSSNPLWRNSTLKQTLKSGVSDVKLPQTVSQLIIFVGLLQFSHHFRLDQFLVDGQTLQEQDVIDEKEQLLFEKKLFGMENTDMSDPVVLHYSYVQVREILIQNLIH